MSGAYRSDPRWIAAHARCVADYDNHDTALVARVAAAMEMYGIEVSCEPSPADAAPSSPDRATCTTPTSPTRTRCRPCVTAGITSKTRSIGWLPTPSNPWAVAPMSDLKTRRRPALVEGPGADISSLAGASGTANSIAAPPRPTLANVRSTIYYRTLTLEAYTYLERLGIITSPICWPPGRRKPLDKRPIAPEPAGRGRVRGERSPQHAAALRARRGLVAR
jgi:hypothetical protein